VASVSAALIVKNESRCIVRCLSSLVNAVDEIVVVDTGSDDNTIELIEQFILEHQKVKLFHFEWCDDFSAARNFSLSKVTGDWVFVVDADEHLHPEDMHKLKNLADRYSCSDAPILMDVLLWDVKQGEIEEFYTGLLRLFPANVGIRYEGKIHESLAKESLPMAFKRIDTDIRLFHDGYDITVIDWLAKKQRNVYLLNAELQKDPYNARNLMYFGYELASYNKEKGIKFLSMAKGLTSDPQLLQQIDYLYEQVAD